MNIKDLNGIDIKMRLLEGESLSVDNVEIKPLTLNEINKIGYSKYMGYIQLLSLSVDDFLDSFVNEEHSSALEEFKEGLTAFDFLIKFGGDEIQGSLLDALKVLLRTDDVKMITDKDIGIDFVKLGMLEKFKSSDGSFYYDLNEEIIDEIEDKEVKIINRDNFDDISTIIKYQNYMAKVNTEEKEEPANEEARKLIEKMSQFNKKVEDIKSRREDKSDAPSLPTIISSVSARSNGINKLNIWKLTMYQLFDEFIRLQEIDAFEISVKAKMAGSKDKDISHWSSEID